ncbi:MAG: AraC family transcriptional regulator, partial [Sphingobacteriales bacterium]
LFIADRGTEKAERRHPNNYNTILFKNFQNLVDKHYKTKKLTKDYAAMLYITPNHLNALSKDISGRSAGEIIRDRILLEAKRWLINGGITIAEVAAVLEFEDNSYFTKFFKKYEGFTPQEFRKKYLK